MSISPKLARSGPSPTEHPHWSRRHERQRYQPEVLRRLISEYDYQLKFVIDRAPDLSEVEEFLTKFPQVSKGQVLLMPQGTCEEELRRRAVWLKPYCRDQGYTYCARQQIEWFGPVRGT